MSSALVPAGVAAAERAGFPVLRQVPPVVEAEAVRLLPEDAPGIAVAVGGDVLMVVMPAVPTPAQFRALEEASGMPVTVQVAEESVWAHLRHQAASVLPAAAPRAVGSVLTEAATTGATDVFLRVGDVPRARVDHSVCEMSRQPRLSQADLDQAAEWLLGDTKGAQQAMATYAGSRWRVATYHAGGQRELAIRRLPQQPPRLEDLGLPPAVVDLARAPHGLVVFAGPPGAGKSTSIAALLDRVNGTRHGRILTVEDTVEYRLAPRTCSITQRQVGVDIDHPGEAVEGAAAHGADVVMVADLADPRTIRAALRAAQGGALVVAALHSTPSAESAIHRIVSAFPETEQQQIRSQLASSLRAVVAQTLVRSVEQGRQAVCEVLLNNDAVRTLVREGRTHELAVVLEGHIHDGMTSLDRSLANYTAAGRLDEQAARAQATSPDRFAEHLHRAPGRAQRTGESPAAGDHRPPTQGSDAPVASRAAAARKPGVPGVLGQPED